MSDDDRRSDVNGNDAAGDVEAPERIETSRYNLRPRTTANEVGVSHHSSPLYQSVVRGELEEQSTRLLAGLRDALTTAGGLPPITTTSTSAERNRRTDGMTWQRTGGAGSPFELMASRTTGSRRLPKVPTYEMMARSDPGAKRTAGNPLRVRLPFEFDREDIPFVPACSMTAGAQTAAMMFATRMTAVEQARMRQDDVQRSAPTTMEGLPWTAYHALFEQRLRDGERALEKIADRRVETSSELNIHSDPRLLSVGGQRQDADRLDPVTEKCDNARAAGTGGGKAGQQNDAAGPRRDEFHNGAQCGAPRSRC